MFDTIERAGLWILVADLALYVLKETYEEGPAADLISGSLLQQIAMFGAGLIVLGVVLSLLRKVKPQKQSHCSICRVKIPYGKLYCTIHLRKMLEDEKLRNAGIASRRG